MHRCRCDERRRPAVAGDLSRRTRGRLRAGPERLPRRRPPRWADRRRRRRPRAGHELLGRPDRRSRRAMGGSPRTSERGRRCTCARGNRPGDVPAATAVHGPPTHCRGTRRRWVPGSSMRVPFWRRASTWALVSRLRHGTPTRRPTAQRAWRPWWPRRSATRPSTMRSTGTGSDRSWPLPFFGDSSGDHTSKLRPSVSPGPQHPQPAAARMAGAQTPRGLGRPPGPGSPAARPGVLVRAPTPRPGTGRRRDVCAGRLPGWSGPTRAVSVARTASRCSAPGPTPRRAGVRAVAEW